MKLTLQVEPDDEPSDPTEINEESWSIYPFSSRDDFLEWLDDTGRFKTKKLRTRAEKGLAFILSKYKHGDEVWYLGSRYRGVDWQWDGTDYAGVMIWEHHARYMGAKTFEARSKDAEGELKQWQAWRNGHVYSVKLLDPEDEFADPRGNWCGNLYDEAHIIEVVLEQLDLDNDEIVSVTGDCSFMVDGVVWPDVIKECLAKRAENKAAWSAV